jgi:hypothetical protein
MTRLPVNRWWRLSPDWWAVVAAAVALMLIKSGLIVGIGW